MNLKRTKMQSKLILLVSVIIAVVSCVSGGTLLPTLAQPKYFDNDTVQWFPEVMGGIPAQQMNGVVSIQNRYGSHLCSGTLVSYKLILTAASCLSNHIGELLDTSEIRVIGDDTLIVGDGSATRQVQEIEKYYTRSTSGLALIELLNPFTETQTLTYNKVSGYSVGEGHICQVIGWGVESPGEDVRFLKLDVKIISNELANSSKYYNNVLPTRILAAVSLDANSACIGDLGSVLVCDNVVNGILSIGYGCSRPDYPIIFLNTYNDDLLDDNRVSRAKPSKPRPPNSGGIEIIVDDSGAAIKSSQWLTIISFPILIYLINKHVIEF